jgi:hypothetical protein
MSLEPAEGAAPAISLQGPGNARVALADAWAERPAVLFFLRHFG